MVGNGWALAAAVSLERGCILGVCLVLAIAMMYDNMMFTIPKSGIYESYTSAVKESSDETFT
jgi:hypothetical protein